MVTRLCLSDALDPCSSAVGIAAKIDAQHANSELSQDLEGPATIESGTH